MTWQTKRKLSASAFKKIIQTWDISQAAMGRFLGHSQRTTRRWVRGEIEIPVAEAMLLNGMLERNEEPINIPDWKRGDT